MQTDRLFNGHLSSSLGTCEASRFDSNSNRPFRFDSIRKWWDDSTIFESNWFFESNQ